MVLWPFMADYNPDHRIKSSVFSSSCTFHPYGVNFFISGAPGIPGRPGSAADLTISGRSPAAGPAAPHYARARALEATPYGVAFIARSRAR